MLFIHISFSSDHLNASSSKKIISVLYVMRIKFPISLSKESYKSPQGHNTFRIQKNRAEGLACSVLSLIILDILKFPIVFFII